MNILIAGDFCPQNRVAKQFENNDFAAVLEEAKTIITKVDYSIVNFECPVTKGDEKPINKVGPSLHCKENGISAVKWAGFDCLTLANNHFLDYGQEGVKNTLDSCKINKLDSVGGGNNLREASDILYKEIGGKVLAVINCCEHEFSIATEKTAGSNPLKPIQQFYAIKKAKQKSDFVIIIVHGGIEHFQYPSPRMLEVYRFFIETGADVVVNHHQHCPCGYEVYKGKPIFYGLGNFCFDWTGKRDSIWNIGYMVNLYLDNEKINFEIIPYRQCDETPTINILKGKGLADFNMMMKVLCMEIRDEEVLDQRLKEFNYKNDYRYQLMFEPYDGRILNGLYRRGWVPSFISKDRTLSLIDFLFCESHYERVKEFLDRKIKQYDKK